MQDVVIVDYLRTPFSTSRSGEPARDVFNNENMPALAGRLIKKIIGRTKINPEEIGDVLTGCTMQMAEQWLYGGRTVAMLADLPINVPAQGVERVCGAMISRWKSLSPKASLIAFALRK
jgi:acetyl-CoA C-acetyltransferase